MKSKMWPILLLVSILFTSQWDLILSSEYAMENRHLGLFQGDIMIRNGSNFLDRNAVCNRESRWPGGVVYYAVDDTYDEDNRAVIQDAIDEFEKHTCIKWIERTDEEAYVEIQNRAGCWADPGRMGGAQSLSLEAPLCMKKGVIMHEMMHTLGFLHEQSRWDRDDYIQVDWDNIMNGMELNFEKFSPLEIDDLGLDYDYASIMHYTAYMFANDRSQPTLRPKHSGVSLTELGYGQTHSEFTDLDIQKINKFYECPSK